MSNRKKFYFTKFEIALWLFSMAAIIATFIIFDRENFLNPIVSAIGITSTLLCAKGNLFGHVFGIIFSIIYGYISYKCQYFGEMITYLGMTLPMAVFSLISWFRNPSKKGRTEVKVNNIKKKEFVFLIFLSTVVTVAFYFILKALNTANLIVSTVSVWTSFFAASLSMRRSEFYALAYTFNDLVLIVLWSLASINDISYLSVVICFSIFFVNDIYGFICWRKRRVGSETGR